MQTETIPLADLRPAEVNVRMHPEHQINELIRAVEMFGQTRPLVIDENNAILIGNGLYAALQKMQRNAADVLRISGLSPSQKSKLMISDNRIYVLGMDDYSAIIDLVRDMDDYDIPGFDPESLKNLVATSDLATETVINDFGTMSDEEIKGRRPAEATRTKAQNVVVCHFCGKDFVVVT
jgi:hypothetical protein